MEHIAYKGASAAMTDVIANHIPRFVQHLCDRRGPYPRRDRPRARGLIREAAPQLPGCSDLRGGRLSHFVAITWFGLSGPPKMPQDIVDKLNKEVVRILALPQVRERLEKDAITTDRRARRSCPVHRKGNRALGTIAKASGATPE